MEVDDGHDARASVFATLALLAACAGTPSEQPIDAGSGPNPTLPQPESKAIPTVNVAPAKGWSGDQKPSAAAGLRGVELREPISIIRAGSTCCRTATCSSRRPTRRSVPRTRRASRATSWARRRRRPAPACRAPNRITLLRDADGDGSAEFRSVFLKDLNSPFGMALVGNDFYVANTDAVMRYRVSRRRPRSSTGRARRSRTCRPGRSTITGPRT